MNDPRGSLQSPNDRATTFQAVEGPQAEHYSGEVLLVTAYAIVWTVLLLWVALVWRKQSRLNTRLDELERVLDEAAAARDRP
ncbi:MAG: CcmD family protein [Polyangiaceae bacterium]|jgi:CcmD family protein